jgi:uncharacterized membrane protein
MALALGPLAASQAVSWWVLGKDEAAKPWQREAAALVQTLAAGAAMALVSQIYNLPGKWTDLVFWWCVVSVPLAWVLRSQAVALAYLIGIAVWTVAQAADRGFGSSGEVADVRFWYPLLLAGILPLWPGPELRERPASGSRLVLAATVLLGLFAVAAFAADRPAFWLTMLSAAAVLLFPLDRHGIAEPLARKPQVLLGGLALVVMALIATYEDPARHLVKSVGFAIPLAWCWLLLGVVAGFAVLAFRQGRYGAADCEHAVFHRHLIAAGCSRLFLNPSQILVYGRRHRFGDKAFAPLLRALGTVTGRVSQPWLFDDKNGRVPMPHVDAIPADKMLARSA